MFKKAHKAIQRTKMYSKPKFMEISLAFVKTGKKLSISAVWIFIAYFYTRDVELLLFTSHCLAK
jgi:hypothetical protein